MSDFRIHLKKGNSEFELEVTGETQESFNKIVEENIQKYCPEYQLYVCEDVTGKYDFPLRDEGTKALNKFRKEFMSKNHDELIARKLRFSIRFEPEDQSNIESSWRMYVVLERDILTT